MNILHIISGDLWGGAETMAYSLCVELSKDPHNSINVILFNHGKLEKHLSDSGVSTLVLDERKYSNLQILLKTLSYIKTIAPDIIHTHKHKENVIGSFASLITRTPSIRTVHGESEHEITLKDGSKYLFKKLNYFTGRYIQNFIVAVSHNLSRKLSRIYPRDKIATIQNGINLETHIPTYFNKKKTPNNILVIAIIARLVHVKRIDIFITIAKLLLAEDERQYEFRIYGDGPLLNEMKNLSRTYKIQHSVKFMGFVNDINTALQDIDILLITSEHEGLPMNLLEGIMAGAFVISHDVGDIRKVLCDGQCGILIESLTPEDFASAVKYIAKHQRIAKDKSIKAASNVKSNYSSMNMASYYISLYKRAINN